MDKELYYALCQIAQSLLTIGILYTLLVSLPLWIDKLKRIYHQWSINRSYKRARKAISNKIVSDVANCNCDLYFKQFGIHNTNCKELKTIIVYSTNSDDCLF